MRMPIKINRAALPSGLLAIKWLSDLAAVDPRPLWSQRSQADWTRQDFSSLVSGLHIGGTWKTTSVGRHANANRLVVERVRQAQSAGSTSFTILDTGVSDGITCLDLLDDLEPALTSIHLRFYATDLYTTLPVSQQGAWTFIYNPLDRTACMAISSKLVAFSDTRAAPTWLAYLAQRIFLNAPPCPAEAPGSWIDLVQPDLRQRARVDKNIQVLAWDVFTPWSDEASAGRIDLVKAANLLNRSYFGDERICLALENFHRCLRPGGVLLIVENRSNKKRVPTWQEQWSTFERTPDGFLLIQPMQAGGSSFVPAGSDITSLVATWKSKTGA